jgi:2-polyprenyl-6-methoxyphenol hydroxylase-like FAD-dependent oxidoreductase
MAGIVDPFLEAANRVASVAVIAQQRLLARVRFEPEGTPYPFVGMVPQDVTEKILVGELYRKGGSVEYDTTFVSAVEKDGYITATLDRKGERLEVTALFLVGCDGAHSRVRHLLNLSFEGDQYDTSFMSADVDTNEVLAGDELHLCPSEFGPLAIFPMNATRRRLVATVDEVEEDAPSLEFVQMVSAQRAPAGFEIFSLRWSSYFRVHHRHVARMSVGRIFIAGDAAHIHSPFGGQGMNTGLQDVWNLVWKLHFAVRGSASEQLLDSYDAERLPVIKGVIQTTHRITRAMGTASKLAQAVRHTVIPVVSRMSAFQKSFVQNLSELGISYAGSPIIEGSGNRFWDDSLRGGKGIKTRFLLLLGDDSDLSTKKDASQFCDSFDDLVELRCVRQPGITLLRPDGYIGYESTMSHTGAVLETMCSLMKRQTSQQPTTHAQLPEVVITNKGERA